MKSNDLSNLLVGKDRKSRSENNETDIAEEALTKPASLLDDTLSDEKKKTNWKTPIWISALVIAASLLLIYFSGSDNAGKTALDIQDDASRNPELLEKLVNEAKVTETDSPGSGLQAEPLRRNNSVNAESSPAIQTQAGNKLVPRNPAPAVSAVRKTATPSTGQKAATAPPVQKTVVAEEIQRPENMPKLIRDVKEEKPAEKTPAPANASPAPVDPHEKTFTYLEMHNPVADKLVKGGFSNLNYNNWKVIRETNQEVWIDIEASWASGGPAIHHIWSVDMTNEKIKALSQAARNLEALNN